MMLIKWQLTLIFLMELLKPSFQSIAGVTYMDDFDFEERYANVDECDPFYWHPLHLPEYCADMFEKMIRSKMGKHARAKKVKPRKKEKKQEHEVYSLHVPDIRIEYPTMSEETSREFEPPSSELMIDETSQWNPEIVWNESKDVDIESPSPYEKMINLLRRDLASNPSAPTIGYVPNIGQVAVYRQPISKSSQKIIKTLTKAYKKSGHKTRKSQTNKILINPTTLKKLKKKKHGRHRRNKTKT